MEDATLAFDFPEVFLTIFDRLSLSAFLAIVGNTLANFSPALAGFWLGEN